MNVKEALRLSRSYRRFDESIRIPKEHLLTIADAARLSPSGRNAQPLKFYISADPESNALIFPTLSWAGYLPEWNGPEVGERPAAYIIQLLDTDISKTTLADEGITAQSMLLQAVELGYGGCIIASVKRETLKKILDIPEKFEIKNVIALGRPIEKIVIEDIKNGDFKYYRDSEGTHYVPKRPLNEIIFSIRAAV